MGRARYIYRLTAGSTGYGIKYVIVATKNISVRGRAITGDVNRYGWLVMVWPYGQRP